MTEVKVHRLVKRYGGVNAVDGVDIDVATGELIVLLGPSGCGKTTTLRCIAGLEEVDGGHIMIGGEVASRPGHSLAPEKREIGMVFQSYAIWPHLSVFENIAFSLTLRRLPGTEVERRVKDALELVGLDGLASRGAHQLSGGQLQRVALARAIVAEPRVLLFDEPLSNLDAALRERMRFELRQLQQQLGITSIYVTHDQQEAMAIADRIVLLDRGQIVQIDKPMSLYNSPSSLFAAQFIGNANVFSGEVTECDPAATIRVSDDLCLASKRNGFAPREAVHVGFRPEQIRVSLTPLEGPNCFPARIRHNVFLGSLSDLALGIGDLHIRGQSSPPVPWTADTDIWVQIPTEAVIVLRH